MKVICTKEYYDLELKKQIKKGEILEVTKDRAKVLIEHNVAEESKELTIKRIPKKK